MVYGLSIRHIGRPWCGMAFQAIEEVANHFVLWSILYHHIGYPWHGAPFLCGYLESFRFVVDYRTVAQSAAYDVFISGDNSIYASIYASCDGTEGCDTDWQLTINNLQITISNIQIIIDCVREYNSHETEDRIH